ncbi:hypothetical protein EZ821_05680 [Salmonella enterica subsp. enterica serovar Adelaide]|nr:hypothetical protein [Salmonella enterica subsp. enterica serovar Adelaide]ECC9078414.1 hypothetical protein [Salmonella enterica subsp. enterica]EEG3102643.1 Rpn family recombination-promoting nuclease/putative transposase [Salmonella enterica]ECF2138793.1 hypothetical protein [Salmonella enterica subsp. enterica serovar Adelaide]ECG4563441.1 hypothetical protein [Salmonella enterica subsp. enterica serovar Adelaide]
MSICHRLCWLSVTDTLQLESASFVDADLRPYISDILWSVETTRGTGYVYALIEHLCKENDYVKFIDGNVVFSPHRLFY